MDSIDISVGLEVEVKMIRVFPRRTKWTPTDNLAFVGDPPLFRPQHQPVYISCTFSWDMPEAERLARSWSRFYSDVKVGGPAYGDQGGEFEPGRFLKTGVTITSRGCIRHCPWCIVPKREGGIRELEIRDGWIVQDDNLLACSDDHIHAVFEMLARQPRAASFHGGLDARLLQPWHVDLLKTIRLEEAWFACDSPEAVKPLESVADLMSDFNIGKKRCYVLVGFNGGSVLEAEQRLETVYALGFLPFAMLYKNDTLETQRWSPGWSRLLKKWCRPAAYRNGSALNPKRLDKSSVGVAQETKLTPACW